MENLNFTIKNKPISFNFAVAFIITSVALALMMILLIVACRIYEKIPLIWFIEVIPAVMLGLSIFKLYIFYKEEFSLQDGEFRYIKVFKKPVIIKVSSISRVYMRNFGCLDKIEFMDKQGGIAATLYDDGTVLQNGIFIEALEKLEIPVVMNDYDDE